MWHMIDNPGMQQFQNLFLYYLSHCIVKPTLGLPRWYGIGICRDAMSAKSRVNALEILE
jgi:hypothetical protein